MTFAIPEPMVLTVVPAASVASASDCPKAECGTLATSADKTSAGNPRRDRLAIQAAFILPPFFALPTRGQIRSPGNVLSSEQIKVRDELSRRPASHPRDHLGPILDHPGLAVAYVGDELGETRSAQRAQPLAQLGHGAGPGDAPDQLGVDELLFLGPQDHQVAAMGREVARIRGLIGLVDRAES